MIIIIVADSLFGDQLIVTALVVNTPDPMPLNDCIYILTVLASGGLHVLKLHFEVACWRFSCIHRCIVI